eukprot:5009746-Amphidinium_carterae.1
MTPCMAMLYPLCLSKPSNGGSSIWSSDHRQCEDCCSTLAHRQSCGLMLRVKVGLVQSCTVKVVYRSFAYTRLLAPEIIVRQLLPRADSRGSRTGRPGGCMNSLRLSSWGWPPNRSNKDTWESAELLSHQRNANTDGWIICNNGLISDTLVAYLMTWGHPWHW